MLHHSGLSDGFWAEALLTAVHIINMSPSKPLGSKIPQELWTQHKPDYGKPQIFGFSDARRTHLCQRMIVVNSSHGHRNAFSLDTDLTEVSAIDYGTWRLIKSSEVRT
jgi:hypothetical protein